MQNWGFEGLGLQCSVGADHVDLMGFQAVLGLGFLSRVGIKNEETYIQIYHDLFIHVEGQALMEFTVSL